MSVRTTSWWCAPITALCLTVVGCASTADAPSDADDEEGELTGSTDSIKSDCGKPSSTKRDAGAAKDTGTAQPRGDGGTSEEEPEPSNDTRTLLPFREGDTWTYKVSGSNGASMKVTTVGPMEKVGARYTPASREVAAHGIGEARQLDFHSPYGCSKGAADQYVLDYARTYGIPATVFRMSCIYGPRQFGTEDQGWVAHFLLRAAAGAPLTLYGDGMQVRDILFVEDLVDAFLAAHRDIARIAGRAFNIGGGAANTTSLLELLSVLGELCGVQPTVTFSGWRPGDQRYYVSDVRAFGDAVGWAPRVGVREGLERLYRWVLAMRDRGQARPAAAVSAP